jgi:hypothetical protein
LRRGCRVIAFPCIRENKQRKNKTNQIIKNQEERRCGFAALFVFAATVQPLLLTDTFLMAKLLK